MQGQHAPPMETAEQEDGLPKEKEKALEAREKALEEKEKALEEKEEAHCACGEGGGPRVAEALELTNGRGPRQHFPHQYFMSTRSSWSLSDAMAGEVDVEAIKEW